MSPTSKNYPCTICNDCGQRYGTSAAMISTYHMDTCAWCGEHKPVTEPRDFGYPEYPVKERNR